MTADPIDPGAMPITTVALTNRQLDALIDAVAGHTGAVRIEKLRDAYVRVVLIGPDGEPVDERLLFPR
jgi:hypothetical protein